MSARALERAIGLGVVAFAALLLLIAVPEGVVRPRNVRNIVLRPDFWPFILGWLLLAAGAGLTARAFLAPVEGEGPRPRIWGILRVVYLTAVLVTLAALVDTVGMVWAAMGAFLALLPVMRPERPVAAILVAGLLPLLLYAFFSKFAGVPVPQGDYLRLP